MFRKEYKQANDNIKVDEALLEKTIEAAFAGKTKKKVYYYRTLAPVAAAFVIVIGGSLAYPKLVEKPVIEQRTVVSPVPTEAVAAKTEADVQAVPESTPVTTATPKKAPVTARKAVKSDAVSDINQYKADETAEEALPATDDVQKKTEPLQDMAVEAQNSAAGASEPAVARSIENGVAAYSLPEDNSEGFRQVSYKLIDGTEEYVFETTDGKSFTVTVTDAESDVPENAFYAERNGRIYVLSSRNMTTDELSDAFETLDI